MSKVTSYKELRDQQAQAAVRVSGAHHSSWNGQVEPTEAGRKVKGSAEWNGTLKYNEEKVTAPLKEMFQNSRVYNQDRETLQWYREALKTTFHENIHLTAPEGRSHADGMNAYQSDAVKSLEEGVTESYSHNNLNAYIDELGLEEIAPGIKSVEDRPSYPHYTPAAESLSRSIGRESGVDSDEVMRQMAVVGAEDKFRVAAEIVYDNSDLPDILPESQRAANVQRIEAAMKPPFADLPALENVSRDAVRRPSAKAGARSAEAAYTEVDAIREGKPATTPEQARQQTQQQGQQRGTASPQDRGPIAAQQPKDLQDAMRAGLSGTAPLNGVQRLGANNFGSRGQGAHAGPQRQGPEREV
jgi:hypothetical protein